MQLPGVDVRAQVEQEKGGPLTEREVEIFEERVAAARAWLETYAPESAIVAVQHDALPHAAASLSEDQQRFLAMLSNEAEGEAPTGGEAWQDLIFRTAKQEGVAPRRAFEAIYLAFLGRPNGPRAGWLVASLDPEFVYRRAWHASGWTADGPLP